MLPLMISNVGCRIDSAATTGPSLKVGEGVTTVPGNSSQNLSVECLACLWNASDTAMDRTWCALTLWDSRRCRVICVAFQNCFRIHQEIVAGTMSRLCPGLNDTKRRCLCSLQGMDLSRKNLSAHIGNRSRSSVMPLLK